MLDCTYASPLVQDIRAITYVGGITERRIKAKMKQRASERPRAMMWCGKCTKLPHDVEQYTY